MAKQPEGKSRRQPQRAQLIAAALGQPAAVGAFARSPGGKIGEEDGRRAAAFAAAAFAALVAAAVAANLLLDHHRPTPHAAAACWRAPRGHQQVAGADALRHLAADLQAAQGETAMKRLSSSGPANMPASTISRLTSLTSAAPKTNGKTIR